MQESDVTFFITYIALRKENLRHYYYEKVLDKSEDFSYIYLISVNGVSYYLTS